LVRSSQAFQESAENVHERSTESHTKDTLLEHKAIEPSIYLPSQPHKDQAQKPALAASMIIVTALMFNPAQFRTSWNYKQLFWFVQQCAQK